MSMKSLLQFYTCFLKKKVQLSLELFTAKKNKASLWCIHKTKGIKCSTWTLHYQTTRGRTDRAWLLCHCCFFVHFCFCLCFDVCLAHPWYPNCFPIYTCCFALVFAESSLISKRFVVLPQVSWFWFVCSVLRFCDWWCFLILVFSVV